MENSKEGFQLTDGEAKVIKKLSDRGEAITKKLKDKGLLDKSAAEMLNDHKERMGRRKADPNAPLETPALDAINEMDEGIEK